MEVCKKGTLLIPTGAVRHLHIVMNDPVFSPEHKRESVLLVNLSSIKEGLPYDDACVLEAGEHSFIRHPSYVHYRGAVISSVSRITDKVGLGDYTALEPVSNELYASVLKGFSVSRYTALEVMRFIRKYISDSQ